jgi:hypothetical protein
LRRPGGRPQIAITSRHNQHRKTFCVSVRDAGTSP